MRIPSHTSYRYDSVPDLICVLGRGIERVQTNSGERWRPTRYVEAVDENGRHTGYRRHEASMNDNRSLIAGANANVLALCERWGECKLLNRYPAAIIFAAGRPAYLSGAEPLLTEGQILFETFQRRAGAKESEAIVLAQNRNTKDDIFECARIAAERKLCDIEVITVLVHIPRTAEFIRLAHTEMPRTRFRLTASEAILQKRYARFTKFNTAFEAVRKSRAYLRTEAQEAAGVLALRSGGYRYV